MRVSAAALLATLLACSPAGAQAPSEPPYHLGVGAGFGHMTKSDVNSSAERPLLHGQLGMRVAGTSAAVLEVGLYGLDDDAPARGDVGPGGAVIRRPEVFRVASVLVAARFDFPGGFYIGPGLGVGWHSFAVYEVQNDVVTDAGTSSEAGIAYALTLGKSISLSRRITLALEGFVHVSRGEDSTVPRRVVGLRAAPVWRFGG